MDKPRDKSVVRNRKIRRVIYLVLALGAVGAVSVVLGRLRPAAPTVDRGTVVIDTVKQGTIPRNVRGLGTLVPEEVVQIPAMIRGRVEKRLVYPGTEVGPDTVIFELSNPEMQRDLMDAELAFRSAEAAYNNRRVELDSQMLNQRAQAATIESDYQQAKLEAEANEQLAKERLVSDLVLKRSRMRASELAMRNDLEKQRIAMNTEVMKTQLAVAQAALDQSRTLYDLRKSQYANLRVKARMSGVLQWLEVPIQVGAQVEATTNLARVSDPKRLKAQVRVAETQAKDIAVGQSAEIDARLGVVMTGRVIHIDPSVVNGTRTVEVQLLGELPKGAVPDQNVDGTIELERLENVIYIQRPGFGQEGSTIRLFKLDSDGVHAESVPVELGRYSVQYIEVRSGLRVGDRVIVSDTSTVGDNVNRIKLN